MSDSSSSITAANELRVWAQPQSRMTTKPPRFTLCLCMSLMLVCACLAERKEIISAHNLKSFPLHHELSKRLPVTLLCRWNRSLLFFPPVLLIFAGEMINQIYRWMHDVYLQACMCFLPASVQINAQTFHTSVSCAHASPLLRVNSLAVVFSMWRRDGKWNSWGFRVTNLCCCNYGLSALQRRTVAGGLRQRSLGRVGGFAPLSDWSTPPDSWAGLRDAFHAPAQSLQSYSPGMHPGIFSKVLMMSLRMRLTSTSTLEKWAQSVREESIQLSLQRSLIN